MDQVLPLQKKVQKILVTAVTGANLVLGVTALLSVTMGSPVFAAWCLLLCVALDSADGALARHWGVSSAFGAQLDSLADMTSFVVASLVLSFYWFWPAVPTASLVVAGSLYVLSGAFRLARYNVTGLVGGEFEGMPTTAAATLIALTYLTCPDFPAATGVFLLGLIAVLMVSLLPYPKGSNLLQSPPWLFALLAVGAVVDLRWTVWLAALAYLLSGPSKWFKMRLVPGSRSEPGGSGPLPPGHLG